MRCTLLDPVANPSFNRLIAATDFPLGNRSHRINKKNKSSNITHFES